MPPQPHPLYKTLTTHLHPSPPKTQELDILPPDGSHEPKIHLAPGCIALPKPLLAQLFLTARAVFFEGIEGDGGNEGKESKEGNEGNDARLDATRVLLLWDPNHLTAANFRKRHLLSLRNPTTPPPLPHPPTNNPPSQPPSQPPSPSLLQALASELAFLTSLLTSPLPKATKSPTLWAHRQWLLRAFGTEIGVLRDGDGGLLEREMSIVMAAGDRHPRNYYAWGYARHLPIFAGEGNSSRAKSSAAARGLLASVHAFCLSHPRDISAWAFLVFLFRWLGWPFGSLLPAASRAAIGLIEEEEEEGGEEEGEGEEEGSLRAMEGVVWGTREFVRKYEWRGESVGWFLGMVGGGRGGGKGYG